MKSAAEVWQACMDHIATEVSPKEVKTWFAVLRPAEMTNEHTLVVEAPSHFVCEYIESNYKKPLQNAMRRVIGNNARLTYHAKIDSSSQNASEGCLSSTMMLPPQEIQHSDRSSVAVSLPAVCPDWDTRLLEPFTFETFILGESNRIAASLARRIGQVPGDGMMNPYFIYGMPGVGKTHLMNAIGWEILRNYPTSKVLYLSTSEFIQQYVAASKNKKVPDFVHFYQQVDVLLLDDVQILVGKTHSEQAFFDIFNHLYALGKQIVLSSDRSVSDLNGMSERLQSRMAGALTTSIDRPDYILRKEVLNDLALRNGVVLTPDVSEYIVRHASHSIRELKGVIVNIALHSSMIGRNIDLAMCREIVSRIIDIKEREVTPENIIHLVAETLRIPEQQIKGKSRKQEFVFARHLSMYLISKYTEESLSNIGNLLGGRSHATVIHGCKTIKDSISVNKETSELVGNLEQRLNSATHKGPKSF